MEDSGRGVVPSDMSLAHVMKEANLVEGSPRCVAIERVIEGQQKGGGISIISNRERQLVRD